MLNEIGGKIMVDFFQRDYTISESDDFAKNLIPILIDDDTDDTIEAVPQYLNGSIVGWTIKSRYE